jgi:hypothetical protein
VTWAAGWNVDGQPSKFPPYVTDNFRSAQRWLLEEISYTDCSNGDEDCIEAALDAIAKLRRTEFAEFTAYVNSATDRLRFWIRARVIA